jgi:formyltetrahydrofolate hydrolase
LKNALTVEMIISGLIHSKISIFTFVRYAGKDTMSKDKAPIAFSQEGETLIISVSTTGITDNGLLIKALTVEIQRVIRNHKAYEKYVLSQNKPIERG